MDLDLMFNIWEKKRILEENGYEIVKLRTCIDRQSHLYSHGSEKDLNVGLDEFEQEFAYQLAEEKPHWMSEEEPIKKWDNRYSVENMFKEVVRQKILKLLCE